MDEINWVTQRAECICGSREFVVETTTNSTDDSVTIGPCRCKKCGRDNGVRRTDDPWAAK